MENSLLKRFADYYAATNTDACIVYGHLWVQYNRMVVPVGPTEIDYDLSDQTARILLKRFPRALFLRTQNGCSPAHPPGPWYAVVCRNFTDLPDLSSNTRSKVRRGLNKCSVERVSSRFIAENGFEVYAAAYNNYKHVGKLRISKAQFSMSIDRTASYDDIIHYWGIIANKRLIGYAVNHVYEDIEVNYSTIKFHPEHLKLYPSYALFYEMNRYYLQESNVKSVNDGFRNILHTTNIQDFLIDKFAFEKAYSHLKLVYKPWVSACMNLARPFNQMLNNLSPKVSALLTLDTIATE